MTPPPLPDPPPTQGIGSPAPAGVRGCLPDPSTGPQADPAPGPERLRRLLRQARRALSPAEQRAHALSLARLLGRDRRFLRARRVAAYWPADGELDPRPLLSQAGGGPRELFLPVLRRGAGGGLWLVRYRAGDRLAPNRFAIPEPQRRHRRIAPPGTLDLLLVPLVGFDERGNRIGMGGGFYDRTLGYLRQRRQWRRPRLIGLAHECQRLPRLDPRPWDIPLDAVATELRIYRRTAADAPSPPADP